MARHETVKGKVQDRLQDRLNDLKTLRDEIRVDLHLASLDLREEWKKIENRLPDLAAAAAQAADATGETLANLLSELRKFRDRLQGSSTRRIAGIMSSHPVACAPGDSLAQAVTMMWTQDLGCVPVADADGRVLAMITDRDAAIAACTRGSRMDDIRVDSVMSKTLVSCAPGDDVDKALGLMRAHQIRRLPVVEGDGRLVGIVTLIDVIHALHEDGERERYTGGAREVVTTLAAIAAPPGTKEAAPLN